MSRAHLLGPTLAALCVAIFAVAAPNPAYARRGFAIFNTGDEVFEVADLPPDLQSAEYPGWKLGYKCDRVGIFWANAWTWDCTLVAFDGDETYADLSDELRAELSGQYSMSDAKRGIWNKYGIFLIGALVAFGIFAKVRGDDDDE